MENYTYNTGDIIYATSAPPGIRFIGHKGIISVENNEVFIYHNTPMKNNEFGGSSIKETLTEFKAAGREIKKVEVSGLSGEEIKTRFDETKHKKFNWIIWNCDQFVNYMLYGKKFSSGQKKIFAIAISVFSILAASKYIKKAK